MKKNLFILGLFILFSNGFSCSYIIKKIATRSSDEIVLSHSCEIGIAFNAITDYKVTFPTNPSFELNFIISAVMTELSILLPLKIPISNSFGQ